MSVYRQAIRRKMERQPVMGSKGRPQYGGAGLSRAGAERVVGNAIQKLSGFKGGPHVYPASKPRRKPYSGTPPR